MGLFDSMSPAFEFGHELKRLLDRVKIKSKNMLYGYEVEGLMNEINEIGFDDNNSIISIIGCALNNNVEEKIHMGLVNTIEGNYLAEDGRNVVYHDVEFGVFIADAYGLYLQIKGHKERSTWKIDNIDIPILKGILNS